MNVCTYDLSYVQYLVYGIQQRLRELSIVYVCSLVYYYNRRCDMYSSSVSCCDGATNVLSTLLRTRYGISTTYSIYSRSCCGPFLSTQPRCGTSHHSTYTARVFTDKRNSSNKVACNYPTFCGTHMPTLTRPPSTFDVASPSFTSQPPQQMDPLKRFSAKNI